MKKTVFIALSLLFIATAIHSQINNNLIPFYKDNKWGYCDENLNIVIDKQFDKAKPFFKGIAQVNFMEVDTFYTSLSVVNGEVSSEYILYNKVTSALINTQNEFIAKPFIGEIEMYSDFIICKYGDLIWNAQPTFDEEGNETEIQYVYAMEIDSSIVFNYRGEIILPKRPGIYSKMTENVIFYRNKNYYESEDLITEYFYNSKLFWVSSTKKNKPEIYCNEMCCWSEIETSITSIDFNGVKKQIFNIEPGSRGRLLDENRLLENNTDFYYIFNSKGDTLERGLFWHSSFKAYNEIVHKIESERWRAPLLGAYRFEDRYYIEDIQNESKWFTCITFTDNDHYSKFLINKTNTSLKLGPFDRITPFYKGFAFVQIEYNNENLSQINENGDYTGININIEDIEFTEFPIEDEFDISPYHILINEKNNDINNYYYMRLDGKKYIIK